MERALTTTNAPVAASPDQAESQPEGAAAPGRAPQLDVALSFIKDGFRRAGQRRYGRRPFQFLARFDGASRRPFM